MNKYPIEAVLPHKHPMILIEELLAYDASSAVCSTVIRTTSNFYKPELNGVPAYVGIEYMAQTIAAFANANEIDNGQSVAIGFLVSSRKYSANVSLFELGATLTINVTRLYQEDNGLSVFECQIHQGEKSLVNARINVFQPDEPEQFLAENV